MRVKHRNERGRLSFTRIDDINQLFADTLPIPKMTKHKPGDAEIDGLFYGEWYTDMVYTTGVFFGIDGDPPYMCLVKFNTLKEAEESLINLMLAWSRCRDALYLVPCGTNWIIDPVLTPKGRQ